MWEVKMCRRWSCHSTPDHLNLKCVIPAVCSTHRNWIAVGQFYLSSNPSTAPLLPSCTMPQDHVVCICSRCGDLSFTDSNGQIQRGALVHPSTKSKHLTSDHSPKPPRILTDNQAPEPLVVHRNTQVKNLDHSRQRSTSSMNGMNFYCYSTPWAITNVFIFSRGHHVLYCVALPSLQS